jgi:hypothetical protein
MVRDADPTPIAVFSDPQATPVDRKIPKLIADHSQTIRMSLRIYFVGPASRAGLVTLRVTNFDDGSR